MSGPEVGVLSCPFEVRSIGMEEYRKFKSRRNHSFHAEQGLGTLHPYLSMEPQGWRTDSRVWGHGPDPSGSTWEGERLNASHAVFRAGGP